MKRTVVMVALTLLVGLGAGYALGIHRTATAAAPDAPPPRASTAPALGPAPASVAPAPTQSPDTSLTVEEAKRKLAAWLAAGCPESERGQSREWIEVWSAAEPQTALAFIFAAPRFPGRNYALAVPLATLCRRDPRQVIAWLHANIPEQERGRIAEMVIERIHRDAPREALVLAETEQTPVGGRTYGLLLSTMIRNNPTEALAAFGRLTDGGREMTAAAIANAWMETDRAAALHWIESLHGQPAERSAQLGVLATLVEKDPAQALTLLRQWNLPPKESATFMKMAAYGNPAFVIEHPAEIPTAQRANTLGAALRGLFATEPDRLAAIARANLPAAEAQQVIADAWQNWLSQDRLAAEAWAAGVQDPEIRAGLELRKLRDTARNDPSLFLSSVDSYPAALTEKPLIQNALSQLNADEAGAWIARHPGVVDAGFVAQTAAAFFEWNRDQAIAWVGNLPPGETQNRALASLASQWTDSGDATRAASTIASITDPRLQTGTRFQVFNTLFRKDPAGAVQWLAAQPITPEVRANWETIVSTTAESGTEPGIHLD